MILHPLQHFMGMGGLDEEGVGLEGDPVWRDGAGENGDGAIGILPARGVSDLGSAAVGEIQVEDQAMRSVDELADGVGDARWRWLLGSRCGG